MNTPAFNPETPIRITHRGETRFAPADTWTDVADEMVTRLGPGKPDVQDMRRDTSVRRDAAPASDAKPKLQLVAPQSPREIKGGEHDVIGEARSMIDFEAAVAGGFASAQPIYRRGTRVVDLGVENARESRREHDAKPSVVEACQKFEGLIRDEGRRNVIANIAELRMASDGRLVLPNGDRHVITPNAFASMVAVHHSGIGGAGYLAKCWPKLRAINVNNWFARTLFEETKTRNALPEDEVADWEPAQLAFRLRKNAADEEVFACVSRSYTPFDVDKIAEGLALAMPRDAKCEITYDGERASFDVQFHSDVRPEHYVAGEFFKAGIRIRTDDTGGGSVWINSTVWQKLCLNLIIIDEASREIARIRHVGSVTEIADKFRRSLALAKESLDHFLKAWGYATSEQTEVVAIEEEPLPMKVSDLLPGIFRALDERELVPLRRREEAIPKLMEMVAKDTSYAGQRTNDGKRTGLRATVTNALTRYAHEVNADPWYEDELERAAGRLVYARTPLPYLSAEHA